LKHESRSLVNLIFRHLTAMNTFQKSYFRLRYETYKLKKPVAEA